MPGSGCERVGSSGGGPRGPAARTSRYLTLPLLVAPMEPELVVPDGDCACSSGMQSMCTGLRECSFAWPVSLSASLPAFGCGLLDWPAISSLNSGVVAVVVAPVVEPTVGPLSDPWADPLADPLRVPLSSSGPLLSMDSRVQEVWHPRRRGGCARVVLPEVRAIGARLSRGSAWLGRGKVVRSAYPVVVIFLHLESKNACAMLLLG